MDLGLKISLDNKEALRGIEQVIASMNKMFSAGSTGASNRTGMQSFGQNSGSQNPANSIASITGSLGSGTEAQAVKARLLEAKSILSKNLMDITNEEVLKLKRISAELVGASTGGAITGLVQKDLARFSKALQTYVSNNMEKAIASVSGAGTGFTTRTTASLTSLLKSAGVGTSISDLGGTGLTSVLKQIQGQVPLTKAQTKEVNASFSEIGSTGSQGVVDAELLKISEILNAAIAKMAKAKTDEVKSAAATTPATGKGKGKGSGAGGKADSFKELVESATKFSAGTAKTESELATRANEYTSLLARIDAAAKKTPEVAAAAAMLKEELAKNNAAVVEYIAQKKKELEAATTEVKAATAPKTRGRGKGAAGAGTTTPAEVTPAPTPAPVAPKAPPLPVMSLTPSVTAVDASTTEAYKASRKAAKKAADDAESLGAATKPSDAAISRAFNGLSSTLSNIKKTLLDVAQTAGSGGAVRDTATLTNLVNQTGQGLQNYIAAANQAFNQTTLKSGGNFPPDFIDKAMQSMVTRTAGMPISQVQQNLAKGPLAQDIVKGMGLTGKEAEIATKHLQEVFAVTAKVYGLLSKSSDELNVNTIALAKKHAMTLIEEQKYEEALRLLTKQTLSKLEVDKSGKPRVGTGPFTPTPGGGVPTQAQLAGQGFSPKTAGEITGAQSQIATQADTVNAIKNGDTFMRRASRTAGELMSIYSVLQMTIGSAVGKLMEFTEQANKLEKASATVSAMAGGFTRYSSAVSLAVSQQSKFGGSLEEQLQGFVSLMPVAKNYNVELSQLDNIARRLAIVDPLQGFSGAAIALKEFFSGDVTSLSRRFEIDRKTLNSIKDVGDKASQLQKLDEVLSKMGISQAVLAARTNTAAASFDRAGAAFGNFNVLIGQGLQEAFKGTADDIAKNFEFAGEEVAANLLNQEQTNSILGNMNKLNAGIDNVRLNFSEEVDSTGFKKLATDINMATDSLAKFVSETNTLIDQLNNLRVEQGKPIIPKFAMGEETSAVQTAQLGQSGANLETLLASRTVGTGQNVLSLEERLSKLIPNYSNAAIIQPGPFQDPTGQLFLKSQERAAQSVNVTTEEFSKFKNTLQNSPELTEQLFQSVDLAGKKLIKSADETANKSNEGALRTFVESGGLSNFNVPAMMKTTFTSQYDDKSRRSVQVGKTERDYAAEVKAAQEELLYKTLTADTIQEMITYTKEYIQLNLDIANAQQATAPLLPAAMKSAREIAEGMVKPFNDISFAQNAINNAVSVLNTRAEGQHTILSDIVALEYTRNKFLDRTSQLKIIERAATLGIVDAQGKSTVEQEAQLNLLSTAAIYQAQLTLESDKSVSATQALDSLWGSSGNIRVGLQESVKLAMEFASSLDSLASGSLLSTLSIQDQLGFASARLRPGTRENAVAGPENSGEVFSMAQSALSLTQQSAQAALDNSRTQSKNASDLLKMQRDHNKNIEDENKKFNEANIEATTKYHEDMKKLQEASEIGKRGNKADFYESLVGMNLTPEQSKKYRDQYEGFQTEASALRGQGKFTAAEAVLTAGSKSILDQAKYDKEVLDNNEKIKKGTKEIADLEKEKGQAKTADDKQSIQDRIDAINLDKTQAETRIEQIAGLRILRQEVDDEELKQARLKEEGITKNYEEEMAKRKKDHDDKVGEMELKYKESVKEKQKADDAQTKAQISNMDTVLALYQYQVDFMNYSKLVASNAPKDELMESRKGLYQSQQDILKAATGTPAYTTLKDMFTALETGLKGSGAQTDRAIDYQATQLLAMGDSTTATQTLTKSVDDLNTTLTQLTTQSRETINGRSVVVTRLRVAVD